MDDPRSGLLLVIIVLSAILRLDSALLIWSRRKEIPIFPSALLAVLSPVLCLVTISYATGKGRQRDEASPVRSSVVLLTALLLSQFITGMIYVGFHFVMGWELKAGRALGPGGEPSAFGAEELFFIITLSSLLLFLMLQVLKPDRNIREFFRGRNLLKGSALAFLMVAPLILLSSLVSSLVEGFGVEETATFTGSVEGPWDMLLLGFAIVLVAPLIEELFFRGYLYDRIRKDAGAKFAILSTAFLFSLIHFQPLAFFPILIIGAVMGWLKERTGSIIPSLVLHAGNNLAALVFISFEVSS